MKEPQYNFLICPTCAGQGKIPPSPPLKKEKIPQRPPLKKGEKEGDLCSNCEGKGMALWRQDKLLYWGKPFSKAEIIQGKIKTAVRAAINGVLILFGVIGLVCLGWTLFKSSQDFTLFDLENFYFWQVRSTWMLIFWISVLSDLYAWYRLQRDLALRVRVQKKVYREEEFIQPAPPDWQAINKLPKGSKLDIAQTFSEEAVKSVLLAWKLANKLNHQETRPVHLLASLLNFKTVRIIFGRLGIPADSLTNKIKHVLAEQAGSSQETKGIPSFDFKKTIFYAYLEALETKQPKVDVIQLLTAIGYEEDEAWEILYDLEIDLTKLRNVTAWITIRELLQERWQRSRGRARLRPKSEAGRAMTAVATPYLDRFSQDLTSLAKSGHLDLCIGRDKEIEEIFRVLESGRQSVILVGSPGVGKTTIIEGIAQRMVEEDVPKILSDKRLVGLNVSSLVAGAAAPGQLEQRLNIIFSEILRAGNIILFIDNIHNMIGLSGAGGEAFDIAEVLAQTLEKKYFLALASTTALDYRRYIEKSSALTGVFRRMDIPEMDVNGSIMVLEGKSGNIEYRNKIYFSYDALETAVTLSKQYLHDLYLPDKAIKLIEEAAVFTRRKKGENAVVSREEVAAIVSEKSGVPVTKVTKEEKQTLLELEKRIHERLIDQEEAVTLVSAALRRARAELRDVKRPIVNLLFLGPTGVGKTELAKAVAEIYFGSGKSMIRLDMSEYQEKGSINRMLGVPGGTEGGILTEAVRKNPFALLLLDEIEKAYPDILNIFLQVMEDGRLTDATGRTIDFTNVILIGTSNAGTSFIQGEVRKETPLAEIKNQLINSELKDYFKPEFLNRFDGVVVFKPLTRDEIRQIAKLLLAKVTKRLEEKGITFRATEEAVTELSVEGFDPVFGARPLRRVIQEKVNNALANYLLTGEIGRRDVVVLETKGVIRIEKAKKLGL